nr:hypothetical protein [Tanacetum cinerariifolium]
MKELRRNLFVGTEDEDAHEHVQRVLEIADLFHIPGGLILMMYDGATTWQRSNHSSNDIAVITNRLNSLGCDIKKLKESIHAMQEGYKSRQRDEWINKFRDNMYFDLKKLDDITKNLEVKVERLTQTVLTNEGNTIKNVEAIMEKVKEFMKEPVTRYYNKGKKDHDHLGSWLCGNTIAYCSNYGVAFATTV